MQAGEGKQYVMDEGNYGDNAQGLFGWANNNPSSKNAIYDTEFINSAAVLCPIPPRIHTIPSHPIPSPPFLLGGMPHSRNRADDDGLAMPGYEVAAAVCDILAYVCLYISVLVLLCVFVFVCFCVCVFVCLCVCVSVCLCLLRSIYVCCRVVPAPPT